MEKIRKILYVGSGEDTGPIIDFDSATEFIYVDIMPRNVDSDSIPYNDKYCHGFIDKITDKFKDLGFRLTETRILDDKYHEKVLSYWQIIRGVPKYFNPTVFIFENEEKTRKIKYYVSTNIEYNMCDELSEDIASSDSIAVIGYSPKTLIFDHFKNKKTFIAYSGTCYSYFGKDDDLIGACFENNNTNGDKVYKKYFYDVGYFLESHNEEHSTRSCIEYPITFNGTMELYDIFDEWWDDSYGIQVPYPDSDEDSEESENDDP